MPTRERHAWPDVAFRAQRSETQAPQQSNVSACARGLHLQLVQTFVLLGDTRRRSHLLANATAPFGGRSARIHPAAKGFRTVGSCGGCPALGSLPRSGDGTRIDPTVQPLPLCAMPQRRSQRCVNIPALGNVNKGGNNRTMKRSMRMCVIDKAVRMD
eukprot:5082863-Pyramimonas_sp.AAC.1